MKIYKIIITFTFILLSLNVISTELNAKDDNLLSFQYRAWGMGGDAVNSKAKISFDGKVYSVLAFSEKNVFQTNASTAGDTTTLVLEIEKDGEVKQTQLTISKDYLNSEIVLKVYSEDKLVGQSFLTYLESEGTYVKLDTINVE
ncbi:hypothetical protein N9X61_00720 [Sulfurimonas sp.]|nr:hypothetical protein [Sulfurimonas sp.]